MSNTSIIRIEWRLLDKKRVRVVIAPPEISPDLPAPLSLPILFVHGLGCSGLVWEPTLKKIAERGLCCRSLAPDLPGYGRSEGAPNTRAMSIKELADWLARFLDAENVDRVHVVGNSLGCQIGMAFARRHPQRVGGMVLQGATTGTRHVSPLKYVTGIVVDTFNEPVGYCIRLAGMYLQMGLPRFMQTVAFMMGDDAFASAGNIHAPTLVIRGGKDGIVSDDVARLLAASLPDAAYVPIGDAAHAIEFTDADEFVPAMLNFLERIEPRLSPFGGTAGVFQRATEPV